MGCCTDEIELWVVSCVLLCRVSDSLMAGGQQGRGQPRAARGRKHRGTRCQERSRGGGSHWQVPTAGGHWVPGPLHACVVCGAANARAQAGPGLCSFLGVGGAAPVTASAWQAVRGNDATCRKSHGRADRGPAASLSLLVELQALYLRWLV